MKKFRYLLIALALFLMVMAMAAPVSAGSKYLPVYRYEQVYPNYCAPATAMMTQTYYGLYPYSQYWIGTTMGLVPNSGIGATPAQFMTYINNYQYKSTAEYRMYHYTQSGTPPIGPQFSRIKAEIDANRPVAMFVYEKDPSTGQIRGHSVLIVGYNDVAGTMSDKIRIADPWPGRGTFDTSYYPLENRIWLGGTSYQYNRIITIV